MRGAGVMADSTPPPESFLSRWSQRKAQARTDVVSGESDRTIVDKKTENVTKKEADSAINASTKPATLSSKFDNLDIQERTTPPGPTLDDVAQLTADSDYSAFTAQSVDPKVRNAAMRKLFAADPHFNVMDGLDVYIDDYSVGVPIPKSMLRQKVQARSLGLLDDDLEDQDKPSSADAPNALAANDTGPLHENANLQLQRDDAAGHSGTDERAGAIAERDPPFDAEPDSKPDAGFAADSGQPGPG